MAAPVVTLSSLKSYFALVQDGRVLTVAEAKKTAGLVFQKIGEILAPGDHWANPNLLLAHQFLDDVGGKRRFFLRVDNDRISALIDDGNACPMCLDHPLGPVAGWHQAAIGARSCLHTANKSGDRLHCLGRFAPPQDYWRLRQKWRLGNGRSVCARPTRLVHTGNYGPDTLELATALPDVNLLPPLEAALMHSAKAEVLNSYERVRILPELEAAIRPSRPYDPGAFLATQGGYNAVYTLLHALVPPGLPVAIEDPTAMRLLDILEDLDVPIIPVASDGLGPLPDALKEALKQKPVAFLFQPRVHSVTGASLTTQRLEALGDILEGSDTLIIEDDGVGDVSEAVRHSLGRRFPDRVVYIISYSKTLGPDLRLAVLSGSASVVEQIQSYRSSSAGWTSRILQAAASWLLQDPNTDEIIRRARTKYRERRQALMLVTD
jgi:aspartate/methionine/tyrosine aminotransferase